MIPVNTMAMARSAGPLRVFSELRDGRVGLGVARLAAGDAAQQQQRQGQPTPGDRIAVSHRLPLARHGSSRASESVIGDCTPSGNVALSSKLACRSVSIDFSTTT